MSILALQPKAFPTHKEPSSQSFGKRMPAKEEIAKSLQERISKAEALTIRTRRLFKGKSDISIPIHFGFGTNGVNSGNFKEFYNSPKNTGIINAELALCHRAIVSWRELIPSLRQDSPELFKALVSLGELYYRRSRLCEWNSVHIAEIPGALLFIFQRGAQAMEQSLRYFKMASRCKVEPSIADFNELGIQGSIIWAHEILSHAYGAIATEYRKAGNETKFMRLEGQSKHHVKMRSQLGNKQYPD